MHTISFSSYYIWQKKEAWRRKSSRSSDPEPNSHPLMAILDTVTCQTDSSVSTCVHPSFRALKGGPFSSSFFLFFEKGCQFNSYLSRGPVFGQYSLCKYIKLQPDIFLWRPQFKRKKKERPQKQLLVFPNTTLTVPHYDTFNSPQYININSLLFYLWPCTLIPSNF